MKWLQTEEAFGMKRNIKVIRRTAVFEFESAPRKCGQVN